MRPLKSDLLRCVIACLLGTAAIVGCSASGDSDILDPSTDTDPTEGPNVLPPSNPDEGDDEPAGATDAGKADSGAKDAGKDAAKDAGPPPPAPGDTCTTVDQKFKKTCGKCGYAEAICLASGSSGTVSDYGTCQSEIGVCEPGTVEPCGNCGTRTCSTSCNWGSCTGQPTNSCAPGSVDYSTAGCTTENTFRERTCGSACTWGNYSGTCEAPDTVVAVPTTVGSVSNTLAILSSTQTTGRLTSYNATCPITAAISTTTLTPYTYIRVNNPNPKEAKVAIYNSQAVGGPVINTLLAVYDGTAIPSTDADRKACKGYVAYSGNTTLTGNSVFASLDGTKAVTIPANSSVQVQVFSYYATTSSSPSTGNVLFNVKLESLAP